jgi:AraC family transcriptional regulator of adaptative response / DNA-3-methyladenine glycosylase II
VLDDPDRCYRAIRARDPRFDGWFVSAVDPTGIYCRPSCPAITPKRAHVRFFATAAGAQQAGFRACKRCRPDATPGSPEWDNRADAAARAMRLIADGVVDREGVGGLAGRLGYSRRQVERLLAAEVGAGPLALARAQRAQTARLLIETTPLPISDVAFAAGFASIRQFNDTVRAVFAASPRQLRDRAGRERRPDSQTIGLRLPFRLPFAAQPLFGHLAATAVPGVEEVLDGSYRRTVRLPHGPAIVALRPERDHVAALLTLGDVRDLAAAVARCRRLLDLDADPAAVDDALAGDPALAATVRTRPGQRVPRCVDPAELAVRAVLGQQVTTAAARTVAGRLAASHGEPVTDSVGGLRYLFPDPAALVDVELPGPSARRRAFGRMVAALAGGRIDLGPGADRSDARAGLAALPGVGPWTVEVVAMRGLGDPDAFPASDLGVRRAAAALGLPRSASALSRRAEPWRPWRAYATQYLWSTLDHPVNRFTGPPTRDGAADSNGAKRPERSIA